MPFFIYPQYCLSIKRDERVDAGMHLITTESSFGQNILVRCLCVRVDHFYHLYRSFVYVINMSSTNQIVVPLMVVKRLWHYEIHSCKWSFCINFHLGLVSITLTSVQKGLNFSCTAHRAYMQVYLYAKYFSRSICFTEMSLIIFKVKLDMTDIDCLDILF